LSRLIDRRPGIDSLSSFYFGIIVKIKLAYPKIPDTLNCPLKQCIAFEKIDGTNLHFVWTPQDSFHSFGTRRDRYPYNDAGFAQFSQAHPGLDGIKAAFVAVEQALDAYLLDNPNYATAADSEVIIFAELIGKRSFAGSHHVEDEKKLIIFDVQVGGAMLPPEQFIRDFAAFPLPKVVFQGKFTGQLFKDVRDDKFKVNEGVVVKGVVNGQVYMAKIKTEAYLQKLKEKFGDKWKEYGE
jgi:hypothetical protein